MELLLLPERVCEICVRRIKVRIAASKLVNYWCVAVSSAVQTTFFKAATHVVRVEAVAVAVATHVIDLPVVTHECLCLFQHFLLLVLFVWLL